MGDIAEMMIDGMLCQHCGAYVGPAKGFPRSCRACARWAPKINPNRIACPICKKWVKAVGIDNHMKDVHGTKKTSGN